MKLIDSNILIHAAKPEHAKLKRMLQSGDVAVSHISRLEVLGFHKITEEQTLFFTAIFSIVKIFEVDEVVIDKAIELRKAKNISVGDAIIAATAFINSCELITQNTSDFKHVTGIKITNPILK